MKYFVFQIGVSQVSLQRMYVKVWKNLKLDVHILLMSGISYHYTFFQKMSVVLPPFADMPILLSTHWHFGDIFIIGNDKHIIHFIVSVPKNCEILTKNVLRPDIIKKNKSIKFLYILFCISQNLGTSFFCTNYYKNVHWIVKIVSNWITK